MKTDIDVLDGLSGQKVIVFGDFMVDEYLQGSVSRISPEAPVPVVLVQEQSRRLGGAGNVVLNLEALGAQATAIGLIRCGCFRDAADKWYYHLYENPYNGTASAAASL